MKICNIKNCGAKHYAKGLCKKHHKKQWYENNKKHVSLYRKQYDEENKERKIERIKEWHKNNKEHEKQYRKKYDKEHKEEIASRKSEYDEQYNKEHKEKRAKCKKRYSQTPKGKLVTKASIQRRRLLKLDLKTEVVQQTYEENPKKYGVLTCELCFELIVFGQDSLEHFTPLKRGGDNERSNLGIAHRSCNSKKGTMTLDEWFNRYPELLVKVA